MTTTHTTPMPDADARRSPADGVAAAKAERNVAAAKADGRTADRVFAALAYGSGLLILAVLAAVAG